MKSYADHPAQVAEPKLPADFLGGLQIHLVGVFLDVVIGAEIAAVHVDCHQRFGLFDDDRSAHRQGDFLLVDPRHSGSILNLGKIGSVSA